MPTTKCKLVYQFDELDNKAKDKARDWYREGALDYDWWNSTYEDAGRVGLKISEFDLDCDKHVKGDLTMTVEDSVKAILADHGKDCDTFKLAKEYKTKLRALDKDADSYECDYEQLTEEYTYALCEEYASTLQSEYEYLLSDESVDETIRANEYEFTEDGRCYC